MWKMSVLDVLARRLPSTSTSGLPTDLTPIIIGQSRKPHGLDTLSSICSNVVGDPPWTRPQTKPQPTPETQKAPSTL